MSLSRVTDDKGQTPATTWDFSPVFDFLDTLKIRVDEDEGQQQLDSPRSDHGGKNSLAASEKEGILSQRLRVGLGDFGQLWDILGVKRDTAPGSTIPVFESSIGTANLNDADAYTSDGPLFYPPSSKTVKWKDEDENDSRDLAGTNPDSPPEADTEGLTKNQRKKLYRKLRKTTQSVGKVELPVDRVLTDRKTKKEPRDSGDDTDSFSLLPPRKKSVSKPSTSLTPVKQVKDDFVQDSSTPTHKYNARSKQNLENKENDAKEIKSSITTSKAIDITPSKKDKANVALRRTQALPIPIADSKSPNLSKSPAKSPKKATVMQKSSPPATKFEPPKTPAKQTYAHAAVSNSVSVGKVWPVANPTFPRMQSFHQPSFTSTLHSQVTHTTPQAIKNANSLIVKKQAPLTPLKQQSDVDRNWSLLMKLMHFFPDDKRHLLSPLQMSINRPVEEGIHVFVDASNILIGFQDHLKRARGLPVTAHVQPVDLNFHALALLLERRRPVAKRVLAGSTPEIPAFEAAREVGYETNILDKVWKAKEMTERQRYFMNNPRGNQTPKRYGNGSGYASESDSAAMFGYISSSAGDTMAGQPQVQLHPHKWVEQAVDEILHLKILESIIDTPCGPAGGTQQFGQTGMGQSPEKGMYSAGQRPTMVLATGDAAEAEYSPGFLKMVQRGLAHGWNVEVVAWAQNISMGYRNLQREADRVLVERGEQRFRIIELDEFADELFGGDGN